MSETNVEKFKTKMIKKYKNRKLYDPEDSHYITLSDIKDYVKKGLKVVVKEDAPVKGEPAKDITLLTKIQILQDEAQKKHNAGQSIDFITEAELDNVIKNMKKTETTGTATPEVVVVEATAVAAQQGA